MGVIELLKRSEWKTPECKRHLLTPAVALMAVVAFTNAAGDTPFIGVGQGAGARQGRSAPTRKARREPDQRPDRTLVRSADRNLYLGTVCLTGELMTLPTHPGQSGPHYPMREGPTQGVNAGVGRTSRRGNTALIKELRRFARR